MVIKNKLDPPIFLNVRISKNKPAKNASAKTSFFRIITEANRIIKKVRGKVMRVDSSKIEIKSAKTISFILEQKLLRGS